MGKMTLNDVKPHLTNFFHQEETQLFQSCSLVEDIMVSSHIEQTSLLILQ